MKTAADTIFVGRDRAYNCRFQKMCGHYLVDPVACTPASGWEKGQVENQVGVVQRRFFVPRPKFKSYAALNAWLEDRCVSWAKSHPHQELRDRSIWEVFQDERTSLVPYVGSFDGFLAVPASVSKSYLVCFDKNRYSVDGRSVGRPVEIRAYTAWNWRKADGLTGPALRCGKLLARVSDSLTKLTRRQAFGFR